MTANRDAASGATLEIIAQAGGSADEIRLTLGVYGPDLQPDEVSGLLLCAPTSSHRRGDVRRAGGRPFAEGAWLLAVLGDSSDTPDVLVNRLLGQLPESVVVWEFLRASYVVRLSFGVFFGAWNIGFELSSDTMRRLADLGVPVAFDIYADGNEERL
jgi:hypothetical protein